MCVCVSEKASHSEGDRDGGVDYDYAVYLFNALFQCLCPTFMVVG